VRWVGACVDLGSRLSHKLISSQNASLGRAALAPPIYTHAEVTTPALLPLFSPTKMLFTCCFKSIPLQLLLLHTVAVQIVSSKSSKPEYITLPTLREQAAIQDAWTEQRISNIPNILKKYGVDAWLVRCLSVNAARYRSPVQLSRPSVPAGRALSDRISLAIAKQYLSASLRSCVLFLIYVITFPCCLSF
jgi:hypothetical protein